MRLELDFGIAATYKWPTQKARVVTERWGLENLYCPACSSDRLVSSPPCEPVIDFICPECSEAFQLKSQKHPFRSYVTNSEYNKKIAAIQTGTIPNFFFLHYDVELMAVRNVFLVPKHFISESVIKPRKKLSEHARRRGWQGSIVVLGNLPLDARIPIVKEGIVIPSSEVRGLWQRFMFLRGESIESRGWLSDILACVRNLGKESFTLSEVYSFEEYLARLHPRNRNIRPKIRQQLQVLRDNGVLEFLGRGRYRWKYSSWFRMV